MVTFTFSSKFLSNTEWLKHDLKEYNMFHNILIVEDIKHEKTNFDLVQTAKMSP